MRRFETRWPRSELSANRALPWSESFFRNRLDRWDIGLSANRGFPWTPRLVLDDADQIWWNGMAIFRNAWERVFRPNLDDATVDALPWALS